MKIRFGLLVVMAGLMQVTSVVGFNYVNVYVINKSSAPIYLKEITTAQAKCKKDLSLQIPVSESSIGTANAHLANSKDLHYTSMYFKRVNFDKTYCSDTQENLSQITITNSTGTKFKKDISSLNIGSGGAMLIRFDDTREDGDFLKVTNFNAYLNNGIIKQLVRGLPGNLMSNEFLLTIELK